MTLVTRRVLVLLDVKTGKYRGSWNLEVELLASKGCSFIVSPPTFVFAEAHEILDEIEHEDEHGNSHDDVHKPVVLLHEGVNKPPLLKIQVHENYQPDERDVMPVFDSGSLRNYTCQKSSIRAA